MDKNKTVGKYIAPKLPIITAVVLVKFIGSVAELFLPFLLSYMVDDIAPQKNIPKMLFLADLC
jgi:ATP-binding cassette subfamily B protein